MSKPEGHKESCHYCGKPCDGLAANPQAWPVGIGHVENPGVVKWHHQGCVAYRLYRLDRLEKAQEEDVKYLWVVNNSKEGWDDEFDIRYPVAAFDDAGKLHDWIASLPQERRYYCVVHEVKWHKGEQDPRVSHIIQGLPDRDKGRKLNGKV